MEDSKTNSISDVSDIAQIEAHGSYEQVMLDVSRCSGRAERLKDISFSDPGDSLSLGPHWQDLEQLQTNLARLIVRLLIKKGNVYYYQGFHDVCLAYMTLLGEEEAFKKVDQLIDTHFNIFMQETMDDTQEFLNLIPIIIGLKEPNVKKFLDLSTVGNIFALSWVITWFSHVITDQKDIKKLFESFEKHDPHMVLYFSAEIVLFKKESLLKLEPEMSTVHHYLCNIPRKEKLPIDELLSNAKEAIDKYPPEFVKLDLEKQRKQQMQLQKSIVKRFVPILSNVVTSHSTTAIVILILASAFALQYDRWTKHIAP